MTKYRIVADAYRGYEVQYKPRFWPFWIQAGRNGFSVNTNSTIEEAEEFARQHAKNGRTIVKNLGEL